MRIYERYTPEILEQIRGSIYLPDLVQKYTSLNRNFKGICPFHSEKHPSFSVHPKKQIWHCFGCGRGGDCFTFIMEAEHLSFPNAVKLLAFEAGVRLPESDSIKENLSKKWEEKQKKIADLNYLEDLFKEYENEFYDGFRLQLLLLPPIEERTGKDYAEEAWIEYAFDELDGLLKKRKETFEDMRRKARYGE